MKNIKKIALIIILILGIHTYASTSFDMQSGSSGSIINNDSGVNSGRGYRSGRNSGNGNDAGANSGDGNQAGINSGNGNQDGINSGGNVMMGGGGDDNNALGAGYGSGNINMNSRNLNANSFSSSNSSVPKLSLSGLVAWLASIMNQLVYVIVGAALVAFLFGILKLSFFDGQKPEAREQARKFMFWGIVSLFVMVSVWGLVKLLQVSFFNSGDLIVPRLK